MENKTGNNFVELDIDTFREYISKNDHKYLTAQSALCFAIIARIYRRVLNYYYFGGITIDGDMIVDGNHRYIAYDLARIDFEIIKGTKSHCDEIKKFNEIYIEIDEDWDANNDDTKIFCTDDFLQDGKHLRD